MDELIKYLTGSSDKEEARSINMHLAESKELAEEFVDYLSALAIVDSAISDTVWSGINAGTTPNPA